jgi:hypothetical protein
MSKFRLLSCQAYRYFVDTTQRAKLVVAANFKLVAGISLTV